MGSNGAMLCSAAAVRGRGDCPEVGGNVFTSLKPRVQHLSAPSATVVNVNGAGDCLVAGSLAGLISGCSTIKALAMGIVAGKRAVESPKNVPADLSFEAVSQEASVQLQKATTVL